MQVVSSKCRAPPRMLLPFAADLKQVFPATVEEEEAVEEVVVVVVVAAVTIDYRRQIKCCG